MKALEKCLCFFKIDGLMVTGLLLLSAIGLTLLYSASDHAPGLLMRQGLRFCLAFGMMLLCARIHPSRYLQWAPYFYALSLILLIYVLFAGHIGKGAQRWMSLGFMRFEPSELMKIALPLMLAWLVHDQSLPPTVQRFSYCLLATCVPIFLTAKQPDLGTAVMLASVAGFFLIFAGLSWKSLTRSAIGIICSLPIIWHLMHDYQRQRVLTFLNPERDPLGSGYHIIQSKIAIGSGGLLGKGFLHGTQAHLNYLPEHATDFIFALLGEEFGLIGCGLLLFAVLLITLRALYIALHASDTFGRLVAGTFALSFFWAVFINIGMVIGLLPVVGLPLPLISYGGTTLVTTLSSFGIILSIHAHKRLMPI